MNELIKISSKVIGTEIVNSVNTRDLHKTLEIDRQFADWIKYQIKSLGLEINVDYITFTTKGNGRPQKEYIVTTDIAKHISMASRTAKGKEVRNYFIEIEKVYNNPNIHELSGRVGGLTSSNNKLRKEVDKLKKKVKRIDSLEVDVDDLKYNQKLLPNKSLDEKLEVVFQKSDILNGEKNNDFWQEALQKSNKFYIEYIKVLKGDGAELQRWAITQIEKANLERNEYSKQRVLANHRYEILLDKINKMKEATKAVVNFDIDTEMRYVDIR